MRNFLVCLCDVRSVWKRLAIEWAKCRRERELRPKRMRAHTHTHTHLLHHSMALGDGHCMQAKKSKRFIWKMVCLLRLTALRFWFYLCLCLCIYLYLFLSFSLFPRQMQLFFPLIHTFSANRLVVDCNWRNWLTQRTNQLSQRPLQSYAKLTVTTKCEQISASLLLSQKPLLL